MKPYKQVLQSLLAEISAMPEADAVLFCGSVQRGEPQETSDLDLYVVTSGTEYWREGRLQDGVTIEIFFNPARTMREWLQTGEPISIHSFSTGELLLDRSGVGAELTALSRALLAAGPKPLTEWQVATWRYRLTDLVEDLEDVITDPATARLLAGLLVPRALDAYCALHRVWGDKPKRLLARVQGLDPELAGLATEFYAGGLDPRLAIAITDRVLAPFGGRIYEYESSRTAIS